MGLCSLLHPWSPLCSLAGQAAASKRLTPPHQDEGDPVILQSWWMISISYLKLTGNVCWGWARDQYISSGPGQQGKSGKISVKKLCAAEYREKVSAEWRFLQASGSVCPMTFQCCLRWPDTETEQRCLKVQAFCLRHWEKNNGVWHEMFCFLMPLSRDSWCVATCLAWLPRSAPACEEGGHARARHCGIYRLELILAQKMRKRWCKIQQRRIAQGRPGLGKAAGLRLGLITSRWLIPRLGFCSFFWTTSVWELAYRSSILQACCMCTVTGDGCGGFASCSVSCFWNCFTLISPVWLPIYCTVGLFLE